MEKQQLSMNAEKDLNTSSGNINTELIAKEDIEKSPFQIITYEKKSFLAMGPYRVSEETENVEELREMIECKDWRLIINVATAMAEIINKKLINN